ncbi:OmpA family protein [Lichenicoccus roseus]|uniref:OmpA-like domain-containing protein n=1 Tax=Lichenicoccus roseus TaxID=2683649 RepID=A0A5R9J904_9PROT|nr:OmpA family protein [Lichenicoccus roseus]TLU72061.1 hypothetical protein FE263_13110 [Lichenicoccus roseus]
MNPVGNVRHALLMILLSASALAPATRAFAQSAGDQRALDSLGGAKPKQAAPAHPAHRHPAHHAVHQAGAQPAASAASSHMPAGVAMPPPVPTTPPAPPIIKPPIINVPLHPEPPPPPVPVVAGAKGKATASHGGTRITFGDGSADLNAGTMQAVRDFAASLKADPVARAQIDAYGNGSPDDPSTPRRLSLSRGLAVRAVLINSGIPSTRIYVRAIGRPLDNSEPDRVDLARSDLDAPTTTSAAVASTPAASTTPAKVP